MNPPLREHEDVDAAARGARRRDDRLHRDRPRAALAAREGLRVRGGRAGDDRPRALRAAPARARARRRAPARPLRRRAHERAGARRRACPRRASRRARAPTSTLIDPDAQWTIDPARLRTKSKNTPFLGREVDGTRRDDDRRQGASCSSERERPAVSPTTTRLARPRRRHRVPRHALRRARRDHRRGRLHDDDDRATRRSSPTRPTTGRSSR